MLGKLRELASPDRLKLVIFDLDGTLVDSVADLKYALDAMYAELEMPGASLEQVRSWVGNGARKLVSRALHYQIESPLDDPETPRFERAYASFLKHYAQCNGQSSVLYEGALALIEQLRASGVKTAIATNKPEQFTRPLLKALGISVDLVISGDSLPVKKPDPMPLLVCVNHLGCDLSEAIMVGDSLNDIQAARALGVKVVAVSYGYNHGVSISDAKPDLLIDSLTELS